MAPGEAWWPNSDLSSARPGPVGRYNRSVPRAGDSPRKPKLLPTLWFRIPFTGEGRQIPRGSGTATPRDLSTFTGEGYPEPKGRQKLRLARTITRPGYAAIVPPHGAWSRATQVRIWPPRLSRSHGSLEPWLAGAMARCPPTHCSVWEGSEPWLQRAMAPVSHGSWRGVVAKFGPE